MCRWKRILATLLFLTVVVLFFRRASFILSRKSLKGAWDMSNKIGGFYNEPRNKYDVMVFGSSHAYCSFVPAVLHQKLNVNTYVFASQLQPLSASYHYILEALKYQRPKLIILDVFQAVFHDFDLDDGVIHSFVDEIPFSLNKIRMVFNAVPAEKRLQAIFNIVKYHGRWEELESDDWNVSRSDYHDPLKGYVFLTEANADLVFPVADLSQKTEAIDEKDEFFLKKIIDLAKQENITLLLVKTPTNDHPQYGSKLRYVERFCAQNGVPFFDLNHHVSKIGLVASQDYYDLRHFNASGARKFSEWFSTDILSDYVSFEPTEPDLFKSDYEYYEKKFREFERR